MPYISQCQRNELKTREPKTIGELNYLMSVAIDSFFETNVISYANLNRVFSTINRVGNLEPIELVANDVEGEFELFSKLRDLRLNFWLDAPVTELIGLQGVLEEIKLELYTRFYVPYENAKRLANGEVYCNLVQQLDKALTK